MIILLPNIFIKIDGSVKMFLTQIDRCNCPITYLFIQKQQEGIVSSYQKLISKIKQTEKKQKKSIN